MLRNLWEFGPADPSHLKRLPAVLLSVLTLSNQMCSHIGHSGSWKECGNAASGTCNPGLLQSTAHDNSFKYMANSAGNPLHKTSTGVDIFFSLIFSYFCFFVAAFSPCHGRLVLLKYIKTYPSDSMSSRRLCSIPRWALMLAYRRCRWGSYVLCTVCVAWSCCLCTFWPNQNQQGTTGLILRKMGPEKY